MSEDLRRKFERQRSAVLGSSGDRDPGHSNQARDILKAAFERRAGEVREQQEQVQQTRRERARKFWQEADNETEES